MYRYEDWIYVAARRTASQATAAGLKKMGWTRIGGHHDPPWGLIVPDAGPYRILTTVRNPYDAITSWYFLDGGRQTFPDGIGADYIDHLMKKNRTKVWPLGGLFWPEADRRFYDGQRPECHLGLVLHFEDLFHELNFFLAALGKSPMLRFPVVNQTTDRPRDWRPFWLPDGIDFIRFHFGDELERFGYEFDGWRNLAGRLKGPTDA